MLKLSTLPRSTFYYYLKTSKTDKDLLRIVFVEPGKPAYAAEIENSLRAKQRAVGGMIEAVSNGDGKLDEDLRLKLQFVTMGYADNYEAIKDDFLKKTFVNCF